MSIFENNRLFENFEAISRIPRGSGFEKAVSDYIASRMNSLCLEVNQDEISNLIIKKPASPGYEDRDAVILQAHLDMVCEKESGSDHDFSKDPLELVIENDWLSANGTSLGADNGIGVAIAMSILESENLAHPPLEVVFTVCEETDFSGAARIDKSMLSASRMINLDHACEREIIVGSCGGTGVTFTMPIERESSVPASFRPYRISLDGLIGGHSGEDIHRGRGNAILLMLRLVELCGLPLVSLEGGSNRLAIPRDASAVVLSCDPALLENNIRDVERLFREEYSAADIRIEMRESNSRLAAFTADSFLRLRTLLRSYPNGIVRMFDKMEGIVESSNNIGIFETDSEIIRLESEIRGSCPSTINDILESIKALGALFDADVETFAAYSPWEAKSNSKLRDLALETYRNLYGFEMTPIAVHAGLECGFFAEGNPALDIISIGPDCENFHSPEERVSISSALRIYDFLKNMLANL